MLYLTTFRSRYGSYVPPKCDLVDFIHTRFTAFPLHRHSFLPDFVTPVAGAIVSKMNKWHRTSTATWISSFDDATKHGVIVILRARRQSRGYHCDISQSAVLETERTDPHKLWLKPVNYTRNYPNKSRYIWLLKPNFAFFRHRTLAD